MDTIAIVGWLVDLALIIAVYLLYQRRALIISLGQAKLSERLGRWSIVSGLEKEIVTYHAEKWGLQKITRHGSTEPIFESLEFRNVLDNAPEWNYVEDGDASARAGFKSPVSITRDGVRYWQIRAFNNDSNDSIIQYVASPGFHESLVWFRRVDRAMKARVLLPEEVVDWWRQVLPMGFSGRLEYFRKYFQGNQDIESMARVIVAVVNELKNKKHTNAIDYCRYFSGSDRDVIKSLGSEGSATLDILPSHRDK